MWCCCGQPDSADGTQLSSVQAAVREKGEDNDAEEPILKSDVLFVETPKAVELTEAKEAKAEVKESTDAKAPVVEIKEETKVEPPAPARSSGPMEFRVRVSKDSNGKLGAGLDTIYDSHCVVKRVDQGGPLDKEKVQKYDRLKEVQGQSLGFAEMLKIIAANNDLEMLFERPKIQEHTLQKSGVKVGLKVDKDSGSCGLVIKDVKGGAAAEMPPGTFKAMDRIVAVDGEEVSNEQMADYIASRPTLRLRVCSYS